MKMEVNMDVELKQTQKVIMTPQLQQGLGILQLPAVELNKYLREQVEVNPLLELEDNIDKGIEESLPDYAIEDPPPDWTEYFTDEDYYDYDDVKAGGDKASLYYEDVGDDSKSLQQHLLEQLVPSNLSETDMRIARYIIESLDENGYISLSKYEIAESLGIDRQTVSRVLSVIQRLDPPGVGARSLRECLLIQLRQKGLLQDDVQSVILGALRELAENKFAYISKQFGISVQRIQEISEMVKQLDPKPGRWFFNGNATRYIIPDILVSKKQGGYNITLHPYSMPNLEINQFYKRLLDTDEVDDAVAGYISQKLEEAVWLIKCVEQRKITLQKVASAIVEQQQEFFDNGIKFLKPLTLKDIAAMVDMHESTVSRAVSGKYMQTPRGMFDMKYFFASGISKSDGGGIAAAAIKEFIQEFIDGEDSNKPLSDNAIALMLNEKGIKISRRTVAKYREEMQLPSSDKRRKL
jgi:RNA polymerase sigma-54 factor